MVLSKPYTCDKSFEERSYGEITYLYNRCVYPPSEDTTLLIKAVNDVEENGIIVEVFSGTGIVSAYSCIREKAKYIVCIDVNPCPVYSSLHTLKINCNKNTMLYDVVQCDSVTCLRESLKNTIILANPPYLRGKRNTGDDCEQQFYDSVEHPNPLNLYNRLFSKLSSYPGSSIIAVFSSLTVTEKEIHALLKRNNLCSLRTYKHHIFFEDIICVEAGRCNGNKNNTRRA